MMNDYDYGIETNVDFKSSPVVTYLDIVRLDRKKEGGSRRKVPKSLINVIDLRVV